MAAIAIAPSNLGEYNSVHSQTKVSSSVFLPVSAFWKFSSRFLSSVNTAIILRGRVLTQVLVTRVIADNKM